MISASRAATGHRGRQRRRLSEAGRSRRLACAALRMLHLLCVLRRHQKRVQALVLLLCARVRQWLLELLLLHPDLRPEFLLSIRPQL